MATQHLDLDEQEQIAQLKHFWNQYGNLISWVLIVVFGSLAVWNGWKYWQRHQAAGASAMYENVETAARSRDVTRLERAVGDMRERFGGTTFAQQASLLAARSFQEANRRDLAQANLNWVIEKSSDPNYLALARLRLASLQMDDKAHEAALRTLAGIDAPAFAGLVADRKGDVHLLMGQREQARAEYEKAHAALKDETEYRRLVEAKLNALGVAVKAAAQASAAGSLK